MRGRVRHEALVDAVRCLKVWPDGFESSKTSFRRTKCMTCQHVLKRLAVWPSLSFVCVAISSRSRTSARASATVSSPPRSTGATSGCCRLIRHRLARLSHRADTGDVYAETRVAALLTLEDETLGPVR
jgi:hypothetical protein